MDFLPPNLLQYCETFTEKESELLYEVNRTTHLKLNASRMLSGHLQGRVLSFISKLINPTNILEIGTYSGYSALCLAEGLKEDGLLITIDPNEETNLLAQFFFKKSPYANQIQLLAGNAKTVIPQLKHKFDLVFIDADKKNYALYYDLIIDKVNTGGVIIADNVLWSGKVLDEKKDEETQTLHDFNKKVNEDSRVSNLLLPIRDGLMVLRRLY
jgi:predicted O-methyltransferase YrrM